MARILSFDNGNFLASGAGYYAVAPPSLTLSVVSTVFSEGATITFRVTGSKLWDEDITVTYATSDGTATAGVDYVAASGTVTIPAGSTTADISVTTIDRDGVQANRTFTLTLSAPVTTSGGTPALDVAAQTVTIEDTDVALPVPSLVVSVLGTAEEGSPLTFRVATADLAPTPVPLTFVYAAEDGTAVNGTDYTATSGNGFIPAGGTSAEYPVQTIARSGYQTARTVRFVITDANTTVTTSEVEGVITDTELPTGDHGYFESLTSGPYAWKSLSFRDQAIIDQYSQKNPNNYVVYSPSTDTHPYAQDAAKIIMKCWNDDPSATVYANTISPSDLTITLGTLDGTAPNPSSAFNSKGAYIRINDEIMQTRDTDPYDRVTGVLQLQARGVAGTTPASHAVGSLVYRSANALRSQVRYPLRTTSGNNYFFTWDAYFDYSHWNAGIGQWKTFQIESDGTSIWLEPRTSFGPGAGVANTPGFDGSVHIGTADCRTYNIAGGDPVYTNNPLTGSYLGPNAYKSSGAALEPQLATFFIRYNCWTRWFFKFTQREDEYDLVSAWMADEYTDPVQLYDELQISIRGTTNKTTKLYEPPKRITNWRLEFDTSTTYIPDARAVDFRDLISYIRNFVVLEGVPDDVSAFLIKPVRSS